MDEDGNIITGGNDSDSDGSGIFDESIDEEDDVLGPDVWVEYAVTQKIDVEKL